MKAIPTKRFSQLIGGMVILCVTALVIWQPQISNAQATATPTALKCDQVVPLAVKNLSTSCNSLDKDQICYGNNSISVEFLDSADSSKLQFSQVGDTIPLSALKSITTAPLDLKNGKWGLAALKVQASLPGATGGQAVTFVLYGDTKVSGIAELDPSIPTPTPYMCTGTTTRATFLRSSPDSNGDKLQPVPANSTVNLTGRLNSNEWVQGDYQGKQGWLPATDKNLKMTCGVADLIVAGPDTAASLAGSGAFYFSTGIGTQASCQDVPAGGLLIQNKGPKVVFRANGADITVASTVLMNAKPNGTMTISALDGPAWVRAGGLHQTAKARQTITVQLGKGLSTGIVKSVTDGLQVAGKPTTPQNLNLNTASIKEACEIAKLAGLSDPCAPLPPPATATKAP
jgi:hypothetical protein